MGAGVIATLVCSRNLLRPMPIIQWQTAFRQHPNAVSRQAKGVADYTPIPIYEYPDPPAPCAIVKNPCGPIRNTPAGFIRSNGESLLRFFDRENGRRCPKPVMHVILGAALLCHEVYRVHPVSGRAHPLHLQPQRGDNSQIHGQETDNRNANP